VPTVLATSAVRAIDRLALMPLFWLVHEIDSGRTVRIEDAGAMIFARLQTTIDGIGGRFVEAHQLDAAIATKIPKRMIGCALSADEAAALLDRLVGYLVTVHTSTANAPSVMMSEIPPIA
jgi:hypothetical protein